MFENFWLGLKPTRSFAIFIGAIGAIFCMALVIAPDLLPAIVGRSGSVWTPINSQQYRIGDGYYYAAWVAEVLRSGLPPDSPSAAEMAGRPLIESVRWFPLAVSAIPGLFISDFRIVYIIDFAGTALVIFLIPYLIAWQVLRSAWGGLIAGMSVLFFIGQWWSYLPIAPGINSAPLVSLWLSSVFRIVTKVAFELFFNIYESEALQGSFRYINSSISAPLLLIYVYGCFSIYCRDKFSILTIVWVGMMSPLMAFSYPSRALAAYFVLAGLASAAILRRRKVPAITLLAIGIGTIVLLLLGGYISYVRRVFAENELWNNIFESESRTLVDRSVWAMLLIVGFNKYTLSFALSLALVWKHRNLRDLTIIVGVLSTGLACTSLFDMSLLWPRFLDRGVDHVWFMCVMLALVAGWTTWVEPSLPRLSRLTVVPIVCFVIFVPLRGFGEYAVASSKNLTRFMASERWETLQWIRKNVDPGAPIAALDWDDITFIPIYTPAKLVVDNMIIGGRSPQDEMRRYVMVWKMLGFERSILKKRLEGMIAAVAHRRSSKFENYRSPPLTSDEEFAASQIAESVLYWPYVVKVNEMAIAASPTQPNPAFVDWAMLLYDNTNVQTVASDLGIKYVLISGAERALDRSIESQSKLVFENTTHKIYAVTAAVEDK